MKKIILCLLMLLAPSAVFADACATNLMPLFTSQQATKLCATFPISSVATSSLLPDDDNTLDLGSASFSWRSLYVDTSIVSAGAQTLQVDADAQRLFTFDASSDTALTMQFGDAGVTATQVLAITASTADADDDSQLVLSGGGANSTSRGATLSLRGNESGSGQVDLYTGSTAGGDITVGAIDDFIILTSQDTQRPITFDSSSDTALSMSFGDGGTTAAQTLYIRASTPDADDDSTVSLCGGGDCSTGRGSYVEMRGNEVAGGILTGRIFMTTSSAATADVFIAAQDDFIVETLAGADVLSIDTATAVATFAGAITSTVGNITATSGNFVATAGDLTLTNGTINVPAAANVGFVAENGANTACDTTCTQGCILGFDAGTSAFVACSSALADSCACAGAGS